MAESTVGQIFMSYSRRDEAVMRRIAMFLREHHIKVWVDNEKLTPGTPIWEAEIEKALDSAFAVIVLLSPDSKKSEWVRREITFAEQFHKRIFPVLVRGTEDTSITIRLIAHQYVDIRHNEEKGLSSLITALSTYLKELETQDEDTKQSIKSERNQNRISYEKTEAIRIAREREIFERQYQLKSSVGQSEGGKYAEPKQKGDSSKRKVLMIGGIVSFLLLFVLGGIFILSLVSSPATEAKILVAPTMELPASPTFTPTPSSTPTTRPASTVTSMPTSTPTNIVIILPSSTQVIPQDPREFIYFYFDNINARNYELTWSLLSDEYRARTNPSGINQYIDFWNDYTVKVTAVSYDFLTTNNVKVKLETIFYKSNTSTDEDLTYYLSSDNPQGIWQFDNAPSIGGSASDTTCNTVTKRLSVGIKATVVTDTDPLLLRISPMESTTILERMPPGTTVTVIDGPICGLYRSAYFWWWKVQSPSGKTGWVVEGSDAIDPIFIRP